MAVKSKIDPYSESAMPDALTAPLTDRVFARAEPSHACRSPLSSSIRIPSRPLNSQQITRLAVLSILCDPGPGDYLRVIGLSRNEWKKLLRWLDLNGLALYFFDQLDILELSHLFPPDVFKRLHRRLIDNTQRTQSMISESIAIQQEFQNARLTYANLKGLSLSPTSVPGPQLRLQFDLDFLVASNSAMRARAILESRGYRLYSMSGRSWQFKFNERPGVSLQDIYKDFHSYTVELHLESNVPGSPSPLDRLEWRELHNVNMPVLSPVDLLLGQGLHAFKHICGESSRAAHLIEFRRHVLNRRRDQNFWRELRDRTKNNSRAAIGLGVIVLLITRVTGNFAPQALTQWTADVLPSALRLWVEMYGHRVALGGYPGNKLYLLLQEELECTGFPRQRPRRKALFPSHLPPSIIRPFPNEPLLVRIRRYSIHLLLILERVRFHIVEGLRFSVEARRWRRIRGLQ